VLLSGLTGCAEDEGDREQEQIRPEQHRGPRPGRACVAASGSGSVSCWLTLTRGRQGDPGDRVGDADARGCCQRTAIVCAPDGTSGAARAASGREGRSCRSRVTVWTSPVRQPDDERLLSLLRAARSAHALERLPGSASRSRCRSSASGLRRRTGAARQLQGSPGQGRNSGVETPRRCASPGRPWPCTPIALHCRRQTSDQGAPAAPAASASATGAASTPGRLQFVARADGGLARLDHEVRARGRLAGEQRHAQGHRRAERAQPPHACGHVQVSRSQRARDLEPGRVAALAGERPRASSAGGSSGSTLGRASARRPSRPSREPRPRAPRRICELQREAVARRTGRRPGCDGPARQAQVQETVGQMRDRDAGAPSTRSSDGLQLASGPDGPSAIRRSMDDRVELEPAVRRGAARPKVW